MRKSLLALAVLGAFAGAANAQSSVTLYGLVDTYVESDKFHNVSNTKLSAGGLSGPRWGMRGSEDLGGGTSAIFTLEGGYNSDAGTLGQGGRLFGRTAMVGFSGGWGQLTVGRQYAPIFYTQADSDTDGYSSFSQPAHLSNINGNTLRQDNQIRYTTATLGTFKGMVSFNPGENPSNASGGSTVGRMFGANFTVGAGPVNIVGGFHRENATSATTGASSFNVLNNRTVYAVGANATFGSFTPVFNFFKQRTDNVTAADSSIKGWSVGSGWGIGPWAAQVQYGQVKNDLVTSANEKFYLLGGDYIFSKRTNLYLRYAAVKDKGGTASASGGYLAVSAIDPDSNNRVLAFGVRHRF